MILMVLKSARSLPIPDPPSSVVRWPISHRHGQARKRTTETEVKGVTGVNVKERRLQRARFVDYWSFRTRRAQY